MVGVHWGLAVLVAGCLVCEGGAEARADEAAPVSAFRVRIQRPELAASVQRALGGAARRLRHPECAAIFGDFKDAAGRTLQANLDSLAVSGPDYLGLIGFYDGLGQTRCLAASRTLAITARGSRTVWVCPQFALEELRDPRLGEFTLLHEALHSLGLGEDPPSAAAITSRVASRCGE